VTTSSPSAPPRRLDRVLDWIERTGNRLPEPFMLFVLLTLVVAVLSSVMAAFGVVFYAFDLPLGPGVGVRIDP
jgi:aminobenzoyl-glutamate transport protein